MKIPGGQSPYFRSNLSFALGQDPNTHNTEKYMPKTESACR